MQVTERRTRLDLAHAMPWLVDKGYPEAPVLRVALNHLHTYKLASQYEAFAPPEARRIARKIEFHDTPTHGHGLTMAQIEWSILQQQCLDRRIPDDATLTRAIAAWEEQRHAKQSTIDWRFAVTNARKKLKRLYPSLPS